MNKRMMNGTEKRFFDVNEACSYYGLGRSTMRKFADTHKAVKKVGRRVLIDRKKLDAAFDEMEG